MLAACADEQVERRGTSAVYSRSPMACSLMSAASSPSRQRAPDCIHDLRAAGIVERDVQGHARGRRPWLPSASAIDARVVVGQLLKAAQDLDAHALLYEVRGLAPDCCLQQCEERARPRRWRAASSRG